MLNKTDYSWLLEGLDIIEIKKNALFTDISYALIEYRKKLGLTQAEFGKKLGYGQSMISKIESLKYNFSIETLCEICHKLDLDIKISLEQYEEREQKIFNNFVEDDICNTKDKHSNTNELPLAA